MKISFLKKNKTQKPHTAFIHSMAGIATCAPVFIVCFFHKTRIFNCAQQYEDWIFHPL